MVCDRPDTLITSEDHLGVRKKGNPPCNAEDNLRVGLLVIESQVQGLLRESWIRGNPDSRNVYIVQTIEARRYKTQDFGPCPDSVRIGLSLAWKASLVIRMLYFLPCNRLHVTLTLSGVNINRRVLVRRTQEQQSYIG